LIEAYCSSENKFTPVQDNVSDNTMVVLLSFDTLIFLIATIFHMD